MDAGLLRDTLGRKLIYFKRLASDRSASTLTRAADMHRWYRPGIQRVGRCRIPVRMTAKGR